MCDNDYTKELEDALHSLCTGISPMYLHEQLEVPLEKATAAVGVVDQIIKKRLRKDARALVNTGEPVDAEFEPVTDNRLKTVADINSHYIQELEKVVILLTGSNKIHEICKLSPGTAAALQSVVNKAKMGWDNSVLGG